MGKSEYVQTLNFGHTEANFRRTTPITSTSASADFVRNNALHVMLSSSNIITSLFCLAWRQFARDAYPQEYSILNRLSLNASFLHLIS